MKLSIVIPVYNVERYIEKCLLSCVKQDIPYSDYEIIVVNDGTPDKSMDIVLSIAQQYDNIIIVNQENQGLSAARNAGLNKVCGEYVWFIDSDDYIEANSLKRIISFLDNGLDILQLQFRWVYEDGTPAVDEPIYNTDGIRDGKYIIEKGGLFAPAQLCIYRVAFLRQYNLNFVEGIYHEDSEFKPRATYYANSINSDTEISYNYLQRSSGSITSSFKLKNGLDILFVMNNLLQFTIDNDMPDCCKWTFFRMMSMNMNSLLIGYRQLNNADKATIRRKLHHNRHLFLCMVKSRKIKYSIEGIFFLLGINMGLSFHKLIR